MADLLARAMAIRDCSKSVEEAGLVKRVPSLSPSDLTGVSHLAPKLSLTSALSGTQQAPRSGIQMLRVYDEQPVKPKRHGTPSGLY